MEGRTVNCNSKILIVDDTVFNLKILQIIFESKFGLIVDQAVSGEEAVMMCRQRVKNRKEMYRLIVMDINMPGLDGVQATEQIRKFADEYVQERGQYMIVAHTAIPEDQFGDSQLKGFDAFLQKPIDNNILQKILKKLGLVN